MAHLAERHAKPTGPIAPPVSSSDNRALPSRHPSKWSVTRRRGFSFGGRTEVLKSARRPTRIGPYPHHCSISINSPDPLRLNALDAVRQIDLGTPPRVLSNLLGHRDPESIFAYVRIATDIGGPIAIHTRAPEGIIAASSGLLVDLR